MSAPLSDPNLCRRGHVGYVLSGVLRLEYEDSSDEIGPGDAFVIRPGTTHRASNAGPEPVRLLVVSPEA
jgi:quercetin dioxygenase-like cupin family protein